MVAFFAVISIGFGAIFVLHPKTLRFKSISGWFVFSSIIFVNIGFLVRYFEMSIYERYSIEVGVAVVSLGLMCFIIGSLAGRKLFYSNRTPSGCFSLYHAGRSLIVLSIVILIPSWAYFYLLGSVPLFDGINAVGSNGLGGLGELQIARLERDSYISSSASRVPFQGLLELTRNIGVPIVAALATVQICRGHSRYWRLGLLLVCVTTSLMAGQRWPLIYLLIAILFAFASTATVSPMKLILPTAFLLSVGVVMSVLQSRTLERFTSWSDAFRFGIENLFDRIFRDQSVSSILNYENDIFGSGELLGRSYFDSLKAYLPGPGESFPVEFYARTTGDNGGYTAAPDFFTETYINFGFFGVIGICLFWGIFLSLIDSLSFSRFREVDIALHAGIAAVLALSCFTGPVFTIGGIALVMVSGVVVSFMSGSGVSPAVRFGASTS